MFLRFLTEARSISPSQHAFLRRRYCFSNLSLQEQRVTRLMDEGHTVIIVNLDLAKAFISEKNRFPLVKLKSFSNWSIFRIMF